MGLLDWITGGTPSPANSAIAQSTPTPPTPATSKYPPTTTTTTSSGPSGPSNAAAPTTPHPAQEPTTLLDEITSGTAPETTDTKLRYAAYGLRIRTLLSATHRYVAYTSDIGESFRPVAHPLLIRTAYGVSWAYIAGDVGYEGYKAWLRQKAEEKAEQGSTAPTPTPTPTSLAAGGGGGELHHGHHHKQQDYRLVALQRLVFQSLASMALPAFTIHSVVRYTGRALRNSKSVRLRTWGPVGLGLAVVPGLPYLFDEPVERGVEWVFEKGEEVVGGMGRGTADKEKVGGEGGKAREL
ncbi:mitochondrial 18 KDa protein-domain-containing protein [Peziza echinospora]|nr:mitochondrial 18 KDa protein-domain-containing protein [Peziza echinospora]